MVKKNKKCQKNKKKYNFLKKYISTLSLKLLKSKNKINNVKSILLNNVNNVKNSVNYVIKYYLINIINNVIYVKK